ncbi:hypothetical protein [Roseibium aggregatum]|uniref:Uncharacterized protein n=1 Tax=Roseibium aggregatum TaxID=187304 RepID=A0A939J3K0_9HYPH|nr:hypothetical protein [Roseibium aggregatum]MBN9669749.1 hypothetical protein [Roseibium aggregatum]
MSVKMHELAPHHLPYFIPLADGSDPMMRNVLIALIILIILIGTFYLYLHSLPERLAHKHGRIQFELVAVLGLLALFTHNQIFWVAALVLAFIQLPDFMAPLESIASSARKIAFGDTAGEAPENVAQEAEAEIESDTGSENAKANAQVSEQETAREPKMPAEVPTQAEERKDT